MKTILRFSAAAVVATSLFACQKEMSSKKADLQSLSSSASTSAVVLSSCGQLRTQTQGGWGSTPSGNNPGSYLHANFQAAFEGALTVGCPEHFFIQLNSAQAVTNLLPVGGKAAVLTSSSVDPAALKNVLVGQLVALKLSVTFDGWFDDFGQSSVSLSEMIIGSGPFKGHTVVEFLEIGEQVLGGCNTEFTPQQVNETASSINENFVDGTTNKGFLLCPEDDGEHIPQ